MNIQKFFAAAGLVALTAGLGNAGTVGYSTTSGAAQNTDFNYTLLLPKFNAALGTLTGVTLYFYGTETVSALSLQNNSTSSQTFTFTATSALTNATNSATATDKFTGETLQQLATGSVTLGAGATQNYIPGTVTNLANCSPACTPIGTGIAATNPITGVKLTGTTIANYIGTGTFSLTGATLAGTTFVGGGGNIKVLQTTIGQVAAEVDYTYTASATPEPSTLLLMGTAFIGLGFLRRKVKPVEAK